MEKYKEKKIKALKELLFEKSFLQFFTEELIRKRFNLSSRSNRFNDAVDENGVRYEIKGTVIRDKGDEYRTNKSTFTEKQILEFLENKDFVLETSKKMCTYEKSSTVRFVSIFNKFEFDKFDRFIGVVYFDDIIKIISCSSESLKENNKISKQFSDKVFSLSLDRNNIKDIIENNLLMSLRYEEIF
jgi:hypothetical protein